MVALDLAEDHVPAFRVKARGGLVQHQHPGLHGQHARNGHPALLTAGQLEGAALQIFLRQAGEGRRPAHPPGDLLLAQAHVFGAESDVFINRLLKQLVLRVLEHQTHRKANLADVLPLGPDILAVQQHLAAGGLQNAVEVGDQGGFAAAGGPDDAHKVALFHREAHVLQRGGGVRHAGVVYMSQMARFNDGCHWFHILTAKGR